MPPLILIDRPSPNFGERKLPAVSMLVLHYTGMRDADVALTRLCDPAAQVSAHYLIDEDGTTYRLVDESQRAWHAGVAYWRGARDINSASIGIELVNPGHEFGYRAFPAAQVEALIDLARDIVARHGISAVNVVGHSDIAPGRKRDPGALFPWPRLATHNLGLWPVLDGLDDGAPDADRFWNNVQAIGYATPTLAEHGADILSPETGAADVISAIQSRYRPPKVDGVLDAETSQIIATLAAQTAAVA